MTSVDVDAFHVNATVFPETAAARFSGDGISAADTTRLLVRALKHDGSYGAARQVASAGARAAAPDESAEGVTGEAPPAHALDRAHATATEKRSATTNRVRMDLS
jgi:hypothetical protein